VSKSGGLSLLNQYLLMSDTFGRALITIRPLVFRLFQHSNIPLADRYLLSIFGQLRVSINAMSDRITLVLSANGPTALSVTDHGWDWIERSQKVGSVFTRYGDEIMELDETLISALLHLRDFINSYRGPLGSTLF